MPQARPQARPVRWGCTHEEVSPTIETRYFEQTRVRRLLRHSDEGDHLWTGTAWVETDRVADYLLVGDFDTEDVPEADAMARWPEAFAG